MRTEVLVVDDDGDLRRFLAACLEDEGHTVLQAPNGRDALDLMRGHPSGLVVVLDLNMPVMSGIEVLRTVDAEPSLSARHGYIVMSLAKQHELAPEVQELLARRHIPFFVKPFDPSELVAAIPHAAQQVGALD